MGMRGGKFVLVQCVCVCVCVCVVDYIIISPMAYREIETWRTPRHKGGKRKSYKSSETLLAVFLKKTQALKAYYNIHMYYA